MQDMANSHVFSLFEEIKPPKKINSEVNAQYLPVDCKQHLIILKDMQPGTSNPCLKKTQSSHIIATSITTDLRAINNRNGAVVTM